MKHQTQQQLNVALAKQAGFTELESSTKYRIFDTHLALKSGKGNLKLFFGRAGAIRHGRIVSTSRPTNRGWLVQKAERAQAVAP